jgi:hypothetical protein
MLLFKAKLLPLGGGGMLRERVMSSSTAKQILPG